MFRSYRFRLRPSNAQYARLSQLLEQQRQLYNAALQERRDAWRLARVSISKLDQQTSLTMIRADDPAGYGAISVKLSRRTLARVDQAMQGFFRRVKCGQAPGFPRFRSRGLFQTMGFDEASGFRFVRNGLAFKGLDGAVRLKGHRSIPACAIIKIATLSYDDHYWWLSVVVALPEAKRHHHARRAVGLDIGVTQLITLSTGEHVPNLRPRAQMERELRRRQRQLARCRRGSNRRAKVRARLARLHRRIANQRHTYLHAVKKRLAQRFGLIAVEKLQVHRLTRSAAGTVEAPGMKVKAKAGLNRALLDASPAVVIGLLRQKAESAAGHIVEVDPEYTSQDCSACGMRVPKPLAQRVHRCGCGLVVPRDVNAARNILVRAVVRPTDGNVTHKGERRPGERRAA